MSVALINRNSKAGFSIYKCFSGFKNYIEVKEIFVPEVSITVKNIIKNIFYIRRMTSKDDVLHITGDIHYVLLGLFNRKTVLTIHDTVLLDNNTKNLKWYFYYLFWFFIPCKIANHVVCISEETQRRLNRYVKCKSIVIPDPVSSCFKTKIKEFSTVKPVILQLGTGWNKNVDNVIKAIEGLDVRLVLIGKINNEIEDLLKEKKIDYINKSNLSDDEIVNEYNECDIVSFPTIYEGFGLPILEAQKVGRCVITSNIEPHKSVAGENGAVFVNPFDIDSIRSGFLELLNNKKLRENIISNGFNNVLSYSEESIVNMYKSIYNN